MVQIVGCWQASSALTLRVERWQFTGVVKAEASQRLTMSTSVYGASVDYVL